MSLKRKSIPFLLLATACVISLTACTQQTSASQAPASDAGTSSQSSQSASSEQSSDQNTVYGKVTAISGSKITYEIGTVKEPGGQGFQSGGSRVSRPEGSRPQGSNAPSGGKGRGSAPGGGRGGFGGNIADRITLTGKSETITISDTSVLKKQEMSAAQSSSSEASGSKAERRGGMQEASASLSDVKAGDYLRITTQKSDSKLISVLILGTSGQK